MKVAFIGLGTMGAPMAQRLADAGHDVAGWDVTAAGRARFSSSASSLEAALSEAEATLTMLPEGRDVAEVYEQDIFRVAPPGTLLMDCSTIDVETTRKLAAQASELDGRREDRDLPPDDCAGCIGQQGRSSVRCQREPGLQLAQRPAVQAGYR